MARILWTAALALAAATVGPKAPRLAAQVPASWDAAVLGVAASCGLDVKARCEAAGCVVLAETPDLDETSSWVRLAFTSTPLVIEVVAHDHGVLEPMTSCGVALKALGATDVRESTPGDGYSYLCATQNRFSASKSLCNSLAGAHVFARRIRTVELFD